MPRGDWCAANGDIAGNRQLLDAHLDRLVERLRGRPRRGQSAGEQRRRNERGPARGAARRMRMGTLHSVH